MAEAKDEVARLQEIARRNPNAKVHIVVFDEERQRRHGVPDPSTGKKPQTRLFIDCGTHDAFVSLDTEYRRIFDTIVNKTMLVDFLIEVLKAQDEETLVAWVKRGHEPDPSKPAGPPKAQLPKW